MSYQASGQASEAGITDGVIKTIPVGSVPTGVAVDPNTGKVYVTNFGSDTVSVIASTTS